jgi:hypothetical protein
MVRSFGLAIIAVRYSVKAASTSVSTTSPGTLKM